MSYVRTVVGGVARTYVNSSFFSNNQRFERKILDNLIKDLTAPLNIGVDPQNINSNSQYFLGKLDEIRFYNIPLGSEDVYHLFKERSRPYYIFSPIHGCF